MINFTFKPGKEIHEFQLVVVIYPKSEISISLETDRYLNIG